MKPKFFSWIYFIIIVIGVFSFFYLNNMESVQNSFINMEEVVIKPPFQKYAPDFDIIVRLIKKAKNLIDLI